MSTTFDFADNVVLFLKIVRTNRRKITAGYKGGNLGYSKTYWGGAEGRGGDGCTHDLGCRRYRAITRGTDHDPSEITNRKRLPDSLIQKHKICDCEIVDCATRQARHPTLWRTSTEKVGLNSRNHDPDWYTERK